MPSFDEHLLESLQRFGRGFPEVHKFLDEFAGKPGIGMRHRCLRHHLEGIEEVRRRFGDSAAEAAKQHIISDLKMEGWTETDTFPRNEQHYIKLGLF
jgi:hypothetical protein